jgi:hypothetical protein
MVLPGLARELSGDRFLTMKWWNRTAQAHKRKLSRAPAITLRTIARYWPVEQTFAAASGLASYRAFEVGVVGWRSN